MSFKNKLDVQDYNMLECWYMERFLHELDISVSSLIVFLCCCQILNKVNFKLGLKYSKMWNSLNLCV